MAFGKVRKGDAVELPDGSFAEVTDKERNGLIGVQQTDGTGKTNGHEMFVKPSEIKAGTEFHDG